MLDILADANVDLTLFLVIYLIIMIGSSLLMILLFGAAISNFKDMTNTLLTQIYMLSTFIEFPWLNRDPSLTELMFYVIFMLIIALFMMRMFIAILDSHYEDMTKDSKLESKGIIAMIYDILKAKRIE